MGWFDRKKKASAAELQAAAAERPNQALPEKAKTLLTALDEELQNVLPDQAPPDVDGLEDKLIQASFNAGEVLFESEEYEEAAEHLFDAAAAGHARAQYYLGEMNYNGWGMPENEIAAAEWYRLAARQGETDAMYKLGLIFHAGEDLPRDFEEAAKWYRLAAEKGHDEAWYALGGMYRIGLIGETEDMQMAVSCWRKAGELGNMTAQIDLAEYYRDAGDMEEAVRWCRLAAAQGSDYAQRLLRDMGCADA